MFGYIVINNQNSVIFLDGDLNFKLRLQKMVHKQIRVRSSDNASTSSGICTDSTDDNDSITTITKQRKKSGIIFSSSEISHILLPLILIYRSSSDGNEDPINHLSSVLGNISFSKIYDNYLILSFADQENRRKDMLQMVEQSILSGFGPLITFCNTDLTTVRRPKEMMAQIMQRMGNFKSKPYMDVKRMLFYSSKVDRIRSIFSKLCSQLSVFIGNNRSLVISHGDVIAAFNSSESAEDIMTSVNTSDLSNVIINSVDGSSNKISQFWLRSSNGVIPYYINVISHQIMENLTLITIIESSENILIRYLYLFSKQIDQIRKSADLNRDLREIRKTVKDIQTLLVDKKSSDQNSTAFLRNPTRTSSFFKSIWLQIEQEIKEINGVEREKPRSESRFSISSIKSAFSTMSLNSSIFSRISMSEKNVPHKLDVLLSYAKRQTNSLIQELCSVSMQYANKTTLPLFHQFMDKFLKQNHITFMRSLEIGSIENEKNLRNFLKPSNYFLEMYAYRVQFNIVQREILHITDDFKQDLQNILSLQPTKTFSCDVAGKSGNWYTVQYVYIPMETSKKTKHNNNGMMNRSSISLTTVFPGYINKNLAEKQSLKMLDYVLQTFTCC